MAKITLRIWILIIALILALLSISPGYSEGVVIKSVEKNSSVYNEGIRGGMIITKINSYPIKNVEDYSKAISEIFNINEGEIKLTITTKKNGEFILLTNNAPNMVVGKIANTNIKTGLDLSGGARALVKPINVSLSAVQIGELVAITEQRLNTFGLSDITIKSARDLEGNNFMLVEVAGSSPSELRELVGKQGKFEAKVGNISVFEGGEKDIREVCRNDASCSGITSCFQTQEGYACNFMFTVYLAEEAAKKHADVTKNISLDETGQYLKDKLYLFVDDQEVDSLLISSDLRGRVTTQISIQGSGSGTTQEEAYKETQANMKKLQTILLTGGLPYKLEIVKLDTISPSLGTVFTKSLIYLGLIVFVFVSVALFIKYRKYKITLAVMLTMFSEAILTLGIAALIRWNLDAPSIAGIIAGIGTGVNDQIVLIDEAVNKESSSLKERIKRALFIILGAFVSIVAAMLPLFWAGAGLLRGFALTTIIGVSVGIIITRPAFADILKQIEE